MGLAGGMVTVYPPEGKGYDNPMYEPLWAAAQDLDIPIGMHIATNRPGPGQDFALEDRNRVRNSFLANADHWVRMSLSDMIFSGVFERFPKLQVGTVEHELSWIPHFLDRIDYTYTQRVQQERYRFKEAMLPSDYFHRNVFAGFQEDAMGIRMSLSDMIFSGVFERYPKLKVGTVEHELSWIPPFLDRIDYTYTQRVQQERYRFKEAMLPSDYFHRNVFAGSMA